MCGICGCSPGGHHSKVSKINSASLRPDLPLREGKSFHPHQHLDTEPKHTHEHECEDRVVHPPGHHDGHITPHSKKVIQIEQDILTKNKLLAARNSGYFEARNLLALNLVSAPGSGKTTLLERTLARLKNEISCFVIEGDQQTSNDARRIAALGVEVVQINTGKGCHLEAGMIQKALRQLQPHGPGILFIENVGNLVCPAMFDLGENARVVIVSVTEGEDKPLKYPDIFHSAHLCILNKTDLLPYVRFDVEKFRQYVHRVSHITQILELSAETGQGMEAWYDWLRRRQSNLYGEASNSSFHQTFPNFSNRDVQV